MFLVEKCACSFLLLLPDPNLPKSQAGTNASDSDSFDLALATDADFPRSAMAKKRKAGEHTSTLRDFFGGPSGAKRKKSASGTQTVKKLARTYPAEEEIIEIIDSEEEDSSRATIEVQPKSQMPDGFGKPLDSLLHGGSQSQKAQDASGCIEEIQEANQGSAAPLEPLALQHADSSFGEGDSGGYESSNTYIAADGDGEWGLGDDERATRMEVDEVDEVEEPEEEPDDEGKFVLPHKSQENGGDEGNTCPLCGRDLFGFDEEVCSWGSNGLTKILGIMHDHKGYVTPCEQVYRHNVPTDLGFPTSMCPFEIHQ
jgi:hypothetical protein